VAFVLRNSSLLEFHSVEKMSFIWTFSSDLEENDNEEGGPGVVFDDDFVPEDDEDDILDEDGDDEEYKPEKKVLAAKRNKPRKGKAPKRKAKVNNVRTGRKKVIATTTRYI
jgi:hypothetical protein